MNRERKQILQLAGLALLVLTALLGNFLIVKFVNRYHANAMFIQNETHVERMNQLHEKEQSLQQEIAVLEGMKLWEDTAYAKKDDK